MQPYDLMGEHGVGDDEAARGEEEAVPDPILAEGHHLRRRLQQVLPQEVELVVGQGLGALATLPE